LSFNGLVVDSQQLLDEPNNAWLWPAMDAFDREQATEYLFHELANSTAAANEGLFNRMHSLMERWQCFGFDWAVVAMRLRNIDGIHPVQRDQ
jgi:hypothetical protein